MKNLIALTRSLRQFEPSFFLERKIDRINHLFLKNNLDACVIGVSGGIDSALTLKLLEQAMHRNGSPIKKITALIMPIYCSGTSGQNESQTRAIELVEQTNCDYLVQDLTSAADAYIKQYEEKSELKVNPWSVGQLASIVRTPCLYFHAALLQQQEFRSLVVGTTNRDEGAYLGFFGKASDAMVDLQPIADLHKSEVYQLAELLSVPQSIMQSVPRGDVWDNKTDEEMIGAPYWFIELYLLMKEFNLLDEFILTNYLQESDRILFHTYASAIEKQHQKNLHKYQVGNPAHFIDCLSRKIPGGW